MTDGEKLFEWAIYLQSLRCFSFLFYFCSSLLVCSFFFFFSSSMLQFFLCSFFFFFLLDFSSRIPLAFKVLYSVSDSLSGRFYDRLFRLEITHVAWTGLRHQIVLCCIVTTNYTYTYTCRSKINNNDERTHFLRKIYLTHFIRKGCKRVAKGLCVRGELETEQTATYWPPVPLSLAALLFRSAEMLNRGSWGPIALCWVLVLSIASYLQLTDSC